MTKAIIASFLLLVGVSHANTIMFVEAAVGGPVSGETLNDQFTGDITGWAARNGGSCASAGTGTTLEISTKGTCHYTGADDGVQPDSADQWAILEFATATADYVGPGVRTKTTAPTVGEFNLVTRVDNLGFHELRDCHSGDECGTIGTTDDVGQSSGTGDQMAIAVAGAVGSEVLCTWRWVTGSTCSDNIPSGCDVSDPATWGDADMCKSATAGWTGNALSGGTYHDCPTATNTLCQVSQTIDSPLAEYTDVILYNGGATTAEIEWFRAGNL